MWAISGIEDCLYLFIYWCSESRFVICQNFGLDGECWMLHDITVQGGERARRWEGDEVMSCEMGVKGTKGNGNGKGNLDGSGPEPQVLLLPLLWSGNGDALFISLHDDL